MTTQMSAHTPLSLPPGANPAEGAETAGVSNLLRYALGLDLQTGSVGLLTLDRTDDGISVRFQHPTNRDGVSYELYESSDLNTWTPVSHQPGATINGVESRIYRRRTSGRAALFYRLRVESP